MTRDLRNRLLNDLVTAADHVRDALTKAESCESQADFDANLDDALLSLRRLVRDVTSLRKHAESFPVEDEA